MVKLGSKKVQETSEKRMGRQGETAVDMSGEEDALTLLQLRLEFVPRQPPRSRSNQAPRSQIIQIFLPDCGPDPVPLDLARRQSGP